MKVTKEMIEFFESKLSITVEVNGNKYVFDKRCDMDLIDSHLCADYITEKTGFGDNFDVVIMLIFMNMQDFFNVNIEKYTVKNFYNYFELIQEGKSITIKQI